MRADRRRATLGLVALAATVAAARSHAQAAPPSPPPVPPRPPRPLLEDARAVRGRLRGFLVNPNGDVDGLLLESGEQVLVDPRTGNGLAARLRPGAEVEATGGRHAALPIVVATDVRAAADAASAPIAEGDAADPPRPRGPRRLEAMRAGGRIERVLYSRRGELHGVLLEDGTAVRFPPAAGAALGDALAAAKPFWASGYGTATPLGRSFEAVAIGRTADDARPVFRSGP
jgi:hypothetical protein